MADKAEKVEVIVAHPYQNHAPGERIELEVEDARNLVFAGYAQFATKAAAKAAGSEK